MRLTIEVFGETIVSRDLLRVRDHADNLRPAFDEIHRHFLDAEKHQFDTEGSAGPSGAWAPLAPSTVAYKAASGLDPRILHATLRLRDSLTDESSPDHVFHTTPSSVTMGSTVPYGVYHQSTQPRHRLPRRPPVDLDETAKREWVRILQRYIMTGASA